VIERAAVARQPLQAFGKQGRAHSAYLTRPPRVTRERTTSALAGRYETPRDAFSVSRRPGQMAAEPGFRGCPSSMPALIPAGRRVDKSRTRRAPVHSLFDELARRQGPLIRRFLARQLMLLYDGASVGARMDRDPRPRTPPGGRDGTPGRLDQRLTPSRTVRNVL